jgi:HK97 family phage major capsid protein
MPTDNRKLLAKADLDTAGLAAGGLLQPQQADRFFRVMIKSAVLMQQINVTPMRGPKERRDKTRFGSRVLKPGVESQALALAERSKPDLSFIELDAKLVKAEVRMSDEVLEDQIERGAYQQTIVETLAAAVARDMDFLISQGDTASGNALLAVLDGFIKQATSNVVAAGVVKLSKEALRDMLKTMPDEFVSDRLWYFTNRQAIADYNDSLADRATSLGDAKVMQAQGVQSVYNNLPVAQVPEFPNALGGGTNETVVLLTERENMLMGMHRDVRVRMGEDISAGQIIIVVSMRLDVKYMHEPAVVKATGILGV